MILSILQMKSPLPSLLSLLDLFLFFFLPYIKTKHIISVVGGLTSVVIETAAAALT